MGGTGSGFYAVIFTMLALMELNLKKDLEEPILQEENCWWSLSLLPLVFAMSNLSYLDQNGLFSGTLLWIFLLSVHSWI